MARDRTIRLLRDDEVGGCQLGNNAFGSCDRDAVYMTTFMRSGLTRLRACAQHGGAFALKKGLDLPMPVRVLVRRRDDVQQQRDVLAHVVREVRDMRRDQAEFYERVAGLFSLSSPSQRRLPLGMDPGAHRQHVWGDARRGATG